MNTGIIHQCRFILEKAKTAKRPDEKQMFLAVYTTLLERRLMENEILESMNAQTTQEAPAGASSEIHRVKS